MKICLLFFCFVCSYALLGQNKISYAYDAAGNRVKREIVLAPKSSVTTTQKFFTEAVAKRNIKIYPNPTDGQLSVEIDNLDGIKSGVITIYDFTNGKQILKKKIDAVRIDLDISNQRQGIYVMNINIDGEITTWKIMKK